jgi:hypothetical protein
MPTASQAAVATAVTAEDTRVAAEPTAPLVYAKATPAGAGMIFQTGLAPFSAIDYSIDNRWQETVAGAIIQVYAGSYSDDWNQGVVVVLGRTGASYPTPGKHGFVYVVSAVGEQLTLRARDGTTFVFDVPTRSFLPTDPNDTATPTGTPLPTLLPQTTPDARSSSVFGGLPPAIATSPPTPGTATVAPTPASDATATSGQ